MPFDHGTQSPVTLDELESISASEWKSIVDGDPVKARLWVESAAHLGSSEAQVVLGEWLLEGRGGLCDAEQAVKWFSKASSQKHPLGMNMLGRCHENGWGVPQDQSRANSLYLAAADLGLPQAMYNYANQLASGKGIEQDHKKALGWYSAASELGYAKAKTKAGRYFEDGLVVEKDPAKAFNCYQQAAEGGDFRGQFCYAGMLAAQGQAAEAFHWLRQVTMSATPAYLAEAGRALQNSEDEGLRAIGREMVSVSESRLLKSEALRESCLPLDSSRSHVYRCVFEK